jgi:hypothetical protein
MLRETRAADVLVNPDFGNDSHLNVHKVAALPMVADAGKEQGVSVQPLPVRPDDLNKGLSLALTGTMGYSFARPHLLHGRMPRPDLAREVLVNPRFADAHGLQVGDDFTAVMVSQQELETTFGNEGGSVSDALEQINRGDAGTRIRLRVAGIGVSPEDVVVDQGFEQRTLVLTPAFFHRYPNADAGYFGIAVGERTLVPGEGASLGTVRLADWLRQSAATASAGA